MLTAIISAALAVSSATWPSVSGAAPASGIGKADAAVVVGVSRSFVLPEVPGAADNATDWFRWLTTGRGIPLANARLLRDGDVTREAVLKEIEAMAGKRKPGGTLWVIFIGHGAPAPSGGGGLLLGADVQPTIESIESRGIPQADVLKLADAGRGPVVAVFDACFTGVASDGSGQALVRGAQVTLPAKRVTTSSKMTVLQASAQVAGPLPQHNRPAFSYLLLGALRGWADDDGDGTVTAQDALDYTSNALVVAVRDRNQTPQLVGAGDVVLAKGARETGPDLVEIVAPAPPVVALAPGEIPKHLLESYERKKLAVAAEGIVRGPYADPVPLTEVLERGRPLNPDAARVVEENDGKFVTGLAAGAAGVGIVGAVTAGVMVWDYTSNNNQFTGVSGAMIYAGLSAASLAGWFGYLTFGPGDEGPVAKAKSDLVQAINDDERRALGLPPERN